MSFYRNYGKRFVDLALALVVFAPLLGILALLVRWRLGSPTLFRQVRPGLHGQPFRLVKFRSMTDARDAAGNLLPDADRLPRFGRFLRSSSLDELPELINVIKGEMSIVGPRPALFNQDDLIALRTASGAHVLTPGITGWAQINGRDDIPITRKVELDTWYLNHRRFLLDLKIIWLTAWHVARGKGVAH